jgi:LPXTG-motif cell wall-anchored protein
MWYKIGQKLSTLTLIILTIIIGAILFYYRKK